MASTVFLALDTAERKACVFSISAGKNGRPSRRGCSSTVAVLNSPTSRGADPGDPK